MTTEKGTMTMPTTEKASTSVPRRKEELRCEMRKLWEDHILWTRQVIVGLVAGLPDTNIAVKRLLRNPIDLERVLAEYYGDQEAAGLRDLLKDHLTIAAELVVAAKAGASGTAEDAERRWYVNANEIATALNKINLNWPKQAVTDMMHEHLKMTKAEAVARLTGKWDVDVKTYDKIHDQILMMADTLTDGIVKQFPARFTS